jgi:hypothetical protein
LSCIWENRNKKPPTASHNLQAEKVHKQKYRVQAVFCKLLLSFFLLLLLLLLLNFQFRCDWQMCWKDNRMGVDNESYRARIGLFNRRQCKLILNSNSIDIIISANMCSFFFD